MFGFSGIFPGFGFHGILPSYIPYLVAMGFGRCDCRPCVIYPRIPFPCITPFPLQRFW